MHAAYLGQTAREVPRLSEDEVLYPEWARLDGFADAAAPMSHDHVFAGSRRAALALRLVAKEAQLTMKLLSKRQARVLILAGVSGVAGLVALSGFQTYGSSVPHASAVRYGQGQAINIPAVTLVTRATPYCPAVDNGVCQSRPGVAGVGGTPPIDEVLVDPEGALYTSVVLPKGAKIIRIEMTGSNTDRGTLADPVAVLSALGPTTGSRIVAAVALAARTGQTTTSISTAVNPGRPIVRADTTYYFRVQVPRAAPGTVVVIKSLRIIYRPRVS